MIRRFLVVLVLLPIVAVLVGFAVANRQDVVVSFDPFNAADGANSVSIPFYLLAFALLAAGVVVGGVATWIKQRKWRAARARLAAKVAVLRRELDELRRRVAVPDVRALPGRALPSVATVSGGTAAAPASTRLTAA